ncbi:MAG: hypothetical protein M3N68_10230 [Actinomycetota bacterium]|nr:hypothetical protein [Actinomycetota bacterium]
MLIVAPGARLDERGCGRRPELSRAKLLDAERFLILLALLAEGPAIAVFWAVAAPVGTVAVCLYYRNRESRLGLSSSPMPYVAVAVAMVAGAFILPSVTSGDLREVVSVFAIAIGYFAFALVDREPILAWLGLALVAVPVAFLATVPDLAAAGSGAVLGAVFLVTGLVLRGRERAVS